jgi:hypothetical protein
MMLILKRIQKLVTFQGRCGENQIATGSIAAACKTISAKLLKIKRNYMNTLQYEHHAGTIVKQSKHMLTYFFSKKV